MGLNGAISGSDLFRKKNAFSNSNASDTYGSLFSWEPNMIIDFRAFQSCRTLSRASWAKRGGSRSWSGMSESETRTQQLSLRICSAFKWTLVKSLISMDLKLKRWVNETKVLNQPSALAALRFLSSLMRGGLYWQCSTLCLATVCTRNSNICSPLQIETS